MDSPPDRPPLEQALIWPDDFGPARVKIITVPHNVHAQFPYTDVLPLFQMIGKNVGIRRAHGRYVLATNIDILLDDATVTYLRDQLTPEIVLRADRYDVPADLTKGAQFNRILAECRHRFFQINLRFGIFDVQRRRFLGMGDSFEAQLLALYNEIRIFGLSELVRRMVRQLVRSLFAAQRAFRRLIAGAHVFLRALLEWLPKIWPLRTMPSRAYWYIRRVLRRIDALIIPMLPRPMRGMLCHTMAIGRCPALRGALYPPKIVREGVAPHGPRALFQPRSPSERRLARSQRLHTNACGDFTLLARDDWFRLRGYPEWPIFSWHIDFRIYVRSRRQ